MGALKELREYERDEKAAERLSVHTMNVYHQGQWKSGGMAMVCETR